MAHHLEGGRVVTHPLAPIRDGQEHAKPDWTSIVREAIIRELVTNRDGFHADALAPLGIPDEHKSIVGSQIARLVNERCMEECGRRKSAIASRNGAKSCIYRMTGRGAEKFAGVGAGVSSPQRPLGSTGVDCGASADPGEPAALFPDEAASARPLNPLVDAEAA
jgi:hypothetical protein